MIRPDDRYVDLDDRYQNARTLGADLFVSVHADGFRLESVKGASVFIWSEEASSSVARNLSEKQRKRIQADIKNIMEDDFNEDAARKAYPEIYKQKIKDSGHVSTADIISSSYNFTPAFIKTDATRNIWTVGYDPNCPGDGTPLSRTPKPNVTRSDGTSQTVFKLVELCICCNSC